MKKQALAGAVLVMGISLTACGQNSQEQTPSTEASTTTTQEAATTEVPTEAPSTEAAQTTVVTGEA